MRRKSIYLACISLSFILLSLDKGKPPPMPLAPYLNGIFTETAPGEVGSWEVVDAYPDIRLPSPLRIIPFQGEDSHLVLSKLGLVYEVDFSTQESRVILDITDRSFKLGEAGTTSIVLHPDFGNAAAPDKQVMFVFYRHKPNPDDWSELGFNRLSKFSYNSLTRTFDPSSEEILIQQYDRATWHNGGGMFFGPDGFLYVSLGDEGFEEHQMTSTQRLDLSLFSGIIRIDVDNDPTRSHPIRRQPNAIWESEWKSTDFEDNYSQGYSIPNDNPWLSPDGSHLEEFYAIGVRSPYSTYYDTMEDEIWLLDVGSDKREEINKVSRGDNLQWPYKEGELDSDIHTKPADIIGNEKAPLFYYDRSVGSAVIGGGIYRGSTFPSLFGKFIMADFIQNKIMAISAVAGQASELEILIPKITSFGIDLPEKPGTSGVHIMDNGDILFSVIGEDHTQLGKILKLKQNVILPDPPAKLSELGVFRDMETLETEDGIIPYSVNAPLWSDRAIKYRWMSIPSEAGSAEQQQILFNGNESWTFPEGSVFIKHFELPLSTDDSGPTARLETRFFIVGTNGVGYGLTYQWNEDGTDATLLTVGDQRQFDITEGGQFAYTQTWDYPSRDQCLSCHNNNANYVLGVNTHQLNGSQFYHDLGLEMNQLEYLSDNSILNVNINDPSIFPKSYNLNEEDIDLELRIRSYLDSNCASCHRLGGIPDVSMDLRRTIPLGFTGTINAPTQSLASDQARVIIQPGDHSVSEFWIRDDSESENMMPPLARNLRDEQYVALLAEWIDGLPEDAGVVNEFIVFPNPSNGNFLIRISDEWQEMTTVIVYSVTGERMFEADYAERTISLQLSNLSSGTYILHVKSGEQEIIDKLVIQ